MWIVLLVSKTNAVEHDVADFPIGIWLAAGD